MLTHEGVIYDRERDVIYLANMNMKPWAKDRNRPISLAEFLVIENNSLMVTAPGLRDYGYNSSPESFPVILMRPAKWDEVSYFIDKKETKRPSAYKDWKEKNCAQLINQVNELLGLGSGSIISVETGSPLTFHDELNMPDGAIYGPQFCIGQYNPGTRTKVQGLYLGGQGTLMPGVVGASLSGLVAAGNIGEVEPLWNKIRESQ